MKHLFLFLICQLSFAFTAWGNPAEIPPAVMFKQLSTTEGLSNNSVRSIFRDSRGFLWIGTESGLNKYDGYSFRQYHRDNSELPDDAIINIFEGPEMNVWIRTSNGYSIYDYKTGKFDNDYKTTLEKLKIPSKNILRIGKTPKNEFWAYDHSKIYILRQLYNRVHARSSLTVGDVMNAIDCLAQICGEELRDGHEVHIEGLGYFAPTLEATQKVTRSTPNKHLKLRLKSISFRPDVRLKQAMTGVSAIRSKYTRHSLKLSEVEIDMKLKEYFADHDVLIRSDFQALCGMARTTANVHLKRLQQEGKLKNVGKPTQPIYRAMPGYYGVSRDAKAGR